MSSPENQAPQNTAGARPGPGAMPKKAAPGTATKNRVAPAVQPVSPQVEKFGRVDDDGSVWVVRSGHDDRKVGEWKAGSPRDGLNHFGERFKDLAVQAATLEARLVTHPDDAAKIRSTADQLREELDTAAVVGDLNALDEHLQEISNNTHAAEKKAAELREQRREEAFNHKSALVKEAEAIAADSTDWRKAGDRIRSILDEWKRIRGLDKRTDDELWKRYSTARDDFKKRRGHHFAELDKQRARAQTIKEGLIEKAEAIQNSTDWARTSGEYRDLMKQWKKAGRAPRKVDDKLWEQFRAAQDVFFEARKAAQEEKDKEYEANADAKQQLIDEYSQKIDPTAKLDTAKQLLHELQDKWEQIGYVPRARIQEFEEKIGALEAKVSEVEDAEWRRNDPEALARIAQFKDRATQLHADAEAARKSGKDKKAAELTEQAAQWEQWAKTAAEAVEN